MSVSRKREEVASGREEESGTLMVFITSSSHTLSDMKKFEKHVMYSKSRVSWGKKKDVDEHFNDMCVPGTSTSALNEESLGSFMTKSTEKFESNN
jgi:hypothetical protein